MITGQWIPLVPSVLIEAGEVEQFLVEDKDVAVWRSMQGHVQIWENRCPHRSVRLSLGQVQGEYLLNLINVRRKVYVPSLMLSLKSQA